jgi:hypothetical protein
MKVFDRIYLPMTTREAGYCVTNIEQQHLARKFCLDVEVVREHLRGMVKTMIPQKTGNKTKAIIDSELKAVMLSTSGRVS